ncbi:MAG: alpha/beta fold hydrolase [Actinoplanes sp.]
MPGAWLGAWSWHPVAKHLRERGHEVVALTLPGLSYGSSPAGLRLSDAVDHVVAEVESRDLEDIVLVSHSWGGYPATGAAHRLTDRISLPLEALRAGLMPGASTELQDLVFHLMVPQPGGYLTDALDVPAVTEIGLAAAYLVGADDQSLGLRTWR